MAEDSREEPVTVEEVTCTTNTVPPEKTEQEPQEEVTQPSEPVSRKRSREDSSDEEDLAPEDKKAKHESEDAAVTIEASKDESEAESERSTEKLNNGDYNESKQTDESKEKHTEPNQESNEVSKEESKVEEVSEKPKFVFGSRSAFGARPQFSMFGSATEKKDTETKEEESTTTKSSTPAFTATKSVFGAKSAFGNAFQSALKKESIFKTVESKPMAEKDDKEKSESISAVPTFQKIHLEKQQVVSGEEDETCVFQVRAKLYHLDLTNVEAGWKEKGVGVLKVNMLKTPTETYKARILMRQDAILKLILNLPLSKDIKTFKGLDSSLSREKFLRFQFFESGKPVQYAVKVKNSEDSQSLYDKVTELIPE